MNHLYETICTFVGAWTIGGLIGDGVIYLYRKARKA